MSSADEFKEAGNKAFSGRNFEEAIECYTKAIQSDPQNHVFYSNRSASYASLEKWEEAVTDSKQCIKLDPSFIKGYYRLATAQIAKHDYNGATTTIKQGMNVDPDNKQLGKLMRIVKSKKADEKLKANQAAAASKMAAMSGSAGVAGDSSLSKEIMDLKEQLRTSAKDMNIVQASVMTAEKSLKVNKITIGELEGIPMEEERKMYRGIGKMFMMQSRDEIFDHLKGEMKDDEKKLEGLKHKKEYLEKRIKSQQQNIIELSTSG
uniref:Hsp70-Hsp90 organising protein n=1 Tax=Chaetoceros debilis TaxID=122233 RepID=A0A7S3V4Z5_9STRA|mmetsp:Transcript_8217/g.12299  ORF Transcript_8217/g.12299 Transcript_8217/m.12299 type:complete len:263 (+) Transcript_8217:109-897(+)